MSRVRRLTIAATALVCAFGLFHCQLSASVITRGDDALRAGDFTAATRLYERAIVLDPASAIAADRLAFNLSMRHDGAHAQRAVAVTTRALGAHGDDASLFADRAFAEVQLRAWRSAEADFARAAVIARDPRYAHFAARMALKSDDPAAALRYAKRALAVDPSFAPASALVRALR